LSEPEGFRLRLDALRDTQDAIKVADLKVNFLVAFHTVVMFVAFPRISDFWNWYARSPGHPLSLLGFAFFGVLLVSLCVSVWHFIQCARARTDSRRHIADAQTTTLFWNDIASQSFEEFRERLSTQGPAAVAAAFEHQLYVSACIARDKYHHVNRCYSWLMVVVLSFIGFMVLLQAIPH